MAVDRTDGNNANGQSTECGRPEAGASGRAAPPVCSAPRPFMEPRPPEPTEGNCRGASGGQVELQRNVIQAARFVSESDVELIVHSPLQRARDTCIGLFGTGTLSGAGLSTLPMLLHPELYEQSIYVRTPQCRKHVASGLCHCALHRSVNAISPDLPSGVHRPRCARSPRGALCRMV